MSYSYDKFLRPITSSDKSIKILDDFNDIKYTIDPFVIQNVSVINNILKISLKSQRIISLHFSTINESKLALTRIQIQIDTLIKNSPVLIDRDVQNYVNTLFNKVSTIVGPTGPQGLTGSADRYFGTSSTTFEIPVIDQSIDIVTQTNLAYTPVQSVVIYSDLPNLYNSDYQEDGAYFIGQIEYYDTETGDMSLVTTFTYGTGTYSFWYLNLAGAITDTNSTLDLTNLTTDIIPAVDSLYNLGTSASQWKSLHVSGQTIYIGGVPLSTDGESLVVNSINLGTTASPLILSGENDVLLLNGMASFGATGPQGPIGPIGPTGAGIQGPTGTDGLQGIQGPTGTDGHYSEFIGTFQSETDLINTYPTPPQLYYWAFAIGSNPEDLWVYRADPSGIWFSEKITLPIGKDGLQGATGADGTQGKDGIVGGQLYYFNESVTGYTASYRHLSNSPVISNEEIITKNLESNESNVLISSYISDSLGLTVIPGGVQRFSLHYLKGSSQSNISTYAVVQLANQNGDKYYDLGATQAIAYSNTQEIGWQNGNVVNINLDIISITTEILATDRIVISLYVNNLDTTTQSVSFYTEGMNNYSYVQTSTTVVPGPQGPTGSQGATGATGAGFSSIDIDYILTMSFRTLYNY